MKVRSAVILTVANLFLAVTVHLAWSALPTGAAAKKVAPLPPQTEEDRLIGVIAKSSPAVVSILIEAPGMQTISVSVDGGQVQQQTDSGNLQEVGRGTGFLVSADGMIVTNRHVANDRISKYTAFLSDGRSFTARVLDIDPVNDLALLKIDVTGLPFLTVAPNDNLRIGQTVIAIGNALGKYDNTVTRGILSGVNRNLDATDERNGRAENLEDILQTDAAINSGNSGGPLLDSNGHVIGVNTAIETDGQGLGFAIPAAEVRKVLAAYARYGAIARPRLGVRYVMIAPELVLKLHLDRKDGALIQASDTGEPGIVPGSPAEAAGLMAGDVIIEADGKKLAGKLTLTKVIQGKSVGDRLKLKLVHGQDIINISVTLDAFAPVLP